MEQRIDLYRIGCLAVGVLGLLLLTLGLQQILTMMLMFLWRGGSQALVAIALASLGLLPGAAIIYYRRQITGKWLLPDARSTSSESVRAAPTRALAVSLLGIYLAAGGVTSLAVGLGRVLFPGDSPPAHFVQVLGPAVGLSIGLGLLLRARQIEKLL